jgi:hypothetical protein
MPSGRDRDLQRATLHDGGGDEITGVRRVDDVHPNVAPPSSLGHGPIHGALVGGSDHQRATRHVSFAKRAPLMPYDPFCGKSRQGLGEPGADHGHLGTRLKKALDFTAGDFAAADHQAALAL